MLVDAQMCSYGPFLNLFLFIILLWPGTGGTGGIVLLQRTGNQLLLETPGSLLLLSSVLQARPYCDPNGMSRMGHSHYVGLYAHLYSLFVHTGSLGGKKFSLCNNDH